MLSHGLVSIVLGVGHCLMLFINQYDALGPGRLEHTIVIVLVVYPFTTEISAWPLSILEPLNVRIKISRFVSYRLCPKKALR
jgi:hypothetical protein